MLTSTDKKYLKSEAHHLKPIFQIGKEGVTLKQTEGIDNALANKELIKVKLLETCPQTVNEVALEISVQTKAEVVHIIGHTIILYKKSKKGIYKL